MMSKDTGGPAFPQDNDATGSAGMTLRDYFAAQALAGMFASDTEAWNCEAQNYPARASSAYRMADAMLKERAK